MPVRRSKRLGRDLPRQVWAGALFCSQLLRPTSASGPQRIPGSGGWTPQCMRPLDGPERPVRRIEVITGAGGRHRWTMDDKARIVEETLEPEAAVSAVARRYGLTLQQLFGWRREARKRSEAREDAGSRFVPAMVALPPTPRRRGQPAAPMSAIELEIGGARVRIGHGRKHRPYRR